MYDNCGIMTIADFNIETITPETKSALDVHNNIITAEQTAASAIMSLCENLKKMRDTELYKSLGFEKFEDYTEQACNIKQRQAYNYIRTYEKLGERFLQSNAQLGITKLQLLTEVCAIDREEFVQSNDLEQMSVSEIKKLIKENQEKGEQLSLLSEKVAKSEECSDEKEKQIAELQAEIQELRSRPIEVAVQEPSAEVIEKAVLEKTKLIEAEFEKKAQSIEAEFYEREQKFRSEAENKIKKAKENAVKKAEKDFQKAVLEAKNTAKAEIEQKFKTEIETAKAEKEEALKKAKEIALKLDKNANSDLVTASIYFSEVQKQLDAFKQYTNKINSSDSAKGEKLKKLATDYLTKFINNL